MKSNISVPLSKIGEALHITFGNFPNPDDSSNLHFQSLMTDGMAHFFHENEITNDALGNPKIFGSITITREDALFRIQGRLSFCIKLECVRSLHNFEDEVSAEMNAFYVSKNSYQSTQYNKLGIHSQNLDEEFEFSASDLETYTFQGSSIVLDELLLDTLYCAIPELPLCRPNCKGLCSECGTDLNHYDISGTPKLIAHSPSCSLSHQNFSSKILLFTEIISI
jgi:uncharacterized metal-binding protein YceD (DUF177 family)